MNPVSERCGRPRRASMVPDATRVFGGHYRPTSNGHSSEMPFRGSPSRARANWSARPTQGSRVSPRDEGAIKSSSPPTGLHWLGSAEALRHVPKAIPCLLIDTPVGQFSYCKVKRRGAPRCRPLSFHRSRSGTTTYSRPVGAGRPSISRLSQNKCTNVFGYGWRIGKPSRSLSYADV